MVKLTPEAPEVVSGRVHEAAGVTATTLLRERDTCSWSFASAMSGQAQPGAD